MPLLDSDFRDSSLRTIGLRQKQVLAFSAKYTFALCDWNLSGDYEGGAEVSGFTESYV